MRENENLNERKEEVGSEPLFDSGTSSDAASENEPQTGDSVTDESLGGNEEPQLPFFKRLLKKLDNFWYHYKWQSLIALFLVVTVTVCSVQMCSKEDYDLYVLYAGGKEISQKSEGNKIPLYQTFLSDFSEICDDYDGNGKVNINFNNFYMLSNEEIKEIESDPVLNEQGLGVNYNALYQNQQTFSDIMMVGSTYYLCFMSDSLYEEYKTQGGVNTFMALTRFVDQESMTGLRWHDNMSIYLKGSGLSFANGLGIRELPENTVICIRNIGALSSSGDKRQQERAIESFKKILATYDTSLIDN